MDGAPAVMELDVVCGGLEEGPRDVINGACVGDVGMSFVLFLVEGRIIIRLLGADKRPQ